jgi:hypothetical protein
MSEKPGMSVFRTATGLAMLIHCDLLLTQVRINKSSKIDPDLFIAGMILKPEPSSMT